MKCPYCHNEIEENLPYCPLCNRKLLEQQKEYNKKKSYIIFYIVIGLLIITLIIFLFLVFNRLNKDKDKPIVTSTTTTTIPIEIPDSKNIGVSSGLENPQNIGVMTLASINDINANVESTVDMIITRVLNEEEVASLVNISDISYEEGYIISGVEYVIYLRDLLYLKDNDINPVLNLTLYDANTTNDIFVANGRHYSGESFSYYNEGNIKNEMSATIQVIYKYPSTKKCYICFGSTKRTLGCYFG